MNLRWYRFQVLLETPFKYNETVIVVLFVGGGGSRGRKAGWGGGGLYAVKYKRTV